MEVIMGEFSSKMRAQFERDIGMDLKDHYNVLVQLKTYKKLVGVVTMFYEKLIDMVSNADLKVKIAVLGESRIQMVLDKKPTPEILGIDVVEFQGYDVDKSVEKLMAMSESLVESGWKQAEVNTTAKAIGFINKHNLTMTKLRGHRVSPKTLDVFLKQVTGYYGFLSEAPRDLEDPFDDPEYWVSVEQEREEYEKESNYVENSSLYTKVRIAGFAIQEGSYFVLYSMDEASLKGVKGDVRVKLAARLHRTACLHGDRLKDQYSVLDPEDDSDEVDEVFVWAKKLKRLHKNSVDVVSQSSVNDLGNILVVKSHKNWRFGDLQILSNPWSKYISFKRCGFTAFSHAVRLDERLNLVEWTSLIDGEVYEAIKGSTQARIAVVPDYEGLPVDVSDLGDGYIVSRSFFHRVTGGKETAKLVVNAVKDKGIIIAVVDDPVIEVSGKKIPVDIIMNRQGERELKAALLGMGTQLARAFLLGNDAVIDPDEHDIQFIEGSIYGRESLFIVGEVMVDRTVDRTVDVRSKRVLYAQCKYFAPEAYTKMEWLYEKQAKKHEPRLARIIDNLESMKQLLVETKTSKRFMNAGEFSSFIKGKSMHVKPSIVNMLGHIVKENRLLTWRDTDLSEEAVRLAFEIIKTPINVFGVEILPTTLVIKHEGVWKLSPEGGLIMSIVYFLWLHSRGKINSQKRDAILIDKLKSLFSLYLGRTRMYLVPEIKVVSGRHATSKSKHGVALPFRPSLVVFLMTQAMKVSEEDAEAWVKSHNLFQINQLFKKLRFMVWRDPIVREIPTTQIQFQMMDVEVIKIGREIAAWIGGDDDDDIVSIFWKGRKFNIKLPA